MCYKNSPKSTKITNNVFCKVLAIKLIVDHTAMYPFKEKIAPLHPAPSGK